MNFDEILNAELGRWKLDLPASSQRQLAEYAKEIEHWNKAINLTSLRDEALVRRLIVEPVWVGRQLQMNGILVDVGSGNGSPGIPLSLTRKFERSILIEPRLKRAVFLRHTIGRLSIQNAEVVRARIEDVPENQIKADWITLQAIDPKWEILNSMKRLATIATRVVWITTKDESPVPTGQSLSIPHSTSKIWIFQLDQT